MITETDVGAMSGLRMIAIYFQAGWLYERRAATIMTDTAWDTLCRRLDTEWDTLPDTEHKRKIDREDLSTGTASGLTDDNVPLICQLAACRRLYELTGEIIETRPVPDLPEDMTLAEALGPLLSPDPPVSRVPDDVPAGTQMALF